MKKYFTYILLTFVAVIYSCILFAQPVISSANMPVIGDSVIIGICSDPVEPGPAGAGQTWDRSALHETEEGYFSFISPSETFWEYHFPTSTVCGRSWSNSFTYYKSTSTTFEQLGSCLLIDTIAPPNDTAKSIYSDAEELLNFPFAFNDMFSDDFAGSNYAFGFTQDFEGDINVEADAHGTLILPNGTYHNVIRYHFTRNQIADFSPAQFKEQWGWISADHRFWLLLMETLDDGFSTSNLVWYNKEPIAKTTTGISMTTNSQLDLYPNPIKQDQGIYIDWDNTEEVTIEITNVSGAIVFSENILLQTGSNFIELTNSFKTTGIYFVNMTNEKKNFTERLVVTQ